MLRSVGRQGLRRRQAPECPRLRNRRCQCGPVSGARDSIRALGEELTIDRTELDDARWFTRAEIADALSGADGAAFQPPPRFAIARTLLERWLDEARGHP